MARSIDFVIVGTPRSGTTLVQRLACELEGVRVPPETHFLRSFAAGLVRRRRFPLEGAALVEELRDFAALETSRGLDLDAELLGSRLGGSVRSALDLFSGIVRTLADEPLLCGEKTPSHLRWWRPLASHMPELRIVGVVRDPRAVVASYFDAWGERPHAVIAERWAIDQRELAKARRTLGPERCLVLRYEDVVGDCDLARRRLAGFLGTTPRSGADPGAPPLHLPWEHWKADATGPLRDDRVERWRDTLPAPVAAETAAIAQRPMRTYGYEASSCSAPGRAGQWLRYRYRLERASEAVHRAVLTGKAGFA